MVWKCSYKRASSKSPSDRQIVLLSPLYGYTETGASGKINILRLGVRLFLYKSDSETRRSRLKTCVANAIPQHRRVFLFECFRDMVLESVGQVGGELQQSLVVPKH